MEILKGIFEGIGEGLTSFGPAFAKAIWQVFCNLFLTFTELEGVITVTDLNPLGYLCVASIVIGMVYKVVPLALNFITRKIKRKRV